jgi:hypothetical protein
MSRHTGALMIAAGVPQAFEGQFGTVTLGYLLSALLTIKLVGRHRVGAVKEIA